MAKTPVGVRRETTGSDLWNPDKFRDHGTVPTAGAIMARIVDGIDADEYDAAYPERLRTTLY